LIVVLIIAILAAIALPNMLEAQNRAKLSRLMIDMRTIGVAISAYRVDQNDFMNLPYYGSVVGGPGMFLRYEMHDGLKGGFGWLLTTPVEYIADIPVDHFWSTASAQCYGIAQASVMMFSVPGGLGYVKPLIKPDRYNFVLMSVGPNHLMYCHDPSALYDPTNGGVSNGDIFWVDTLGFVGGPNTTYAGYDSPYACPCPSG